MFAFATTFFLAASSVAFAAPVPLTRDGDILSAVLAGQGKGAGALNVGNLLGVAGAGAGSGSGSLLAGVSVDGKPDYKHHSSFIGLRSSKDLLDLDLKSKLNAVVDLDLLHDYHYVPHASSLHSRGLLGLDAVGSGKGVLDLDVGKVLDVDLKGMLSGMIDLDVLGGKKQAFHWSAPHGWTKPDWYELGFYHPSTGCWTTDKAAVMAYLQSAGYLLIDAKVSLATTYNHLFPSGLVHPIRSIDHSLRGKLGYYTSVGVFVNVDLDVHALLGSCGLYDPKFHY